MPGAVAIRHVAFEDLGSFAAVLERRGWTISYRDATVDDLGEAEVLAADLLVVLGGPIGAYEEELYPFLTDELRLIEQRLAAGRPVRASIPAGAKRSAGRRLSSPMRGAPLAWRRWATTRRCCIGMAIPSICPKAPGSSPRRR